MSSVNPTVTGSTSAGKTSLQFQTPAAPTSEAGSAFSVASSESGEDVFTFDEIDEEQEGTGYTVGDSEVYIQEKDKNTLAQDTLQMTLAEADAVDWDAWEWPLVRKADALARAAREAAEALLAQILAQGYTFTGDSYPASACYTNPHSSNGGTPVPYRLGLQPMRLLLNVRPLSAKLPLPR